MPGLLSIEFSNKSNEPRFEEKTSEMMAAWVFHEDNIRGIVVQEESLAVIKDGKIEILMHPLEASALWADKETEFTASLKGKLLIVKRKVCLNCCEIFDAPRIVFKVGCLPGAILSIPVFLYLSISMKVDFLSSLILSLFTIPVFIIPLHFLGNLYVKRFFKDQAKAIIQEDCPKCKSSKTEILSILIGKKVEVGDSGEWIRVTAVGKT